jgi:hypothetical protein
VASFVCQDLSLINHCLQNSWDFRRIPGITSSHATDNDSLEAIRAAQAFAKERWLSTGQRSSDKGKSLSKPVIGGRAISNIPSILRTSRWCKRKCLKKTKTSGTPQQMSHRLSSVYSIISIEEILSNFNVTPSGIYILFLSKYQKTSVTALLCTSFISFVMTIWVSQVVFRIVPLCCATVDIKASTLT